MAGGACLFALLTVISPHIFHGALWLSMALLSIAGIYFFLGAPFLGVIQVLVYIGGIITLFIFAIKLTARIDDGSIKQTNQQVVASAVVTVLLLAFFIKSMSFFPWMISSTPTPDLSLEQIGQALLTVYVLPFEFISVILLAAMVGAIVIGRVTKEGPR